MGAFERLRFGRATSPHVLASRRQRASSPAVAAAAAGECRSVATEAEARQRPSLNWGNRHNLAGRAPLATIVDRAVGPRDRQPCIQPVANGAGNQVGLELDCLGVVPALRRHSLKGLKCAVACLGICDDYLCEPFHRFEGPEREVVKERLVQMGLLGTSHGLKPVADQLLTGRQASGKDISGALIHPAHCST